MLEAQLYGNCLTHYRSPTYSKNAEATVLKATFPRNLELLSLKKAIWKLIRRLSSAEEFLDGFFVFSLDRHRRDVTSNTYFEKVYDEREIHMQRRTLLAAASMALTVRLAASCSANIIDFNTWTEVQDPPHPGMTSSIDNASQISLSASGAIPAGTDIGYQSVDGADVATSSTGHYFSVGADFQVAVDFDVMSANSMGLGGIGFGIGEDSAGTNSAGAGLAILNGSPTLYSGAARVNDVNQAALPLALSANSNGRFFVQYDSSSGDITVGVSNTPGAAAPDVINTFTGANVQNNWTDKDLLVSFFLRSDSVVFPPLSAGTVDAVFSNFEVLAGTPIAVPEPGTVGLCVLGLLLSGCRFNDR